MARLAALKVLLEAGANAGIIGKFGQTALHRHHTADEVRLLLAAGAHDNVEDENGRTPLAYALDDKKHYKGQKSLISTLMQTGATRGSGVPQA